MRKVEKYVYETTEIEKGTLSPTLSMREGPTQNPISEPETFRE